MTILTNITLNSLRLKVAYIRLRIVIQTRDRDAGETS